MILTERLQLRMLRLDDLADFHLILSDPEVLRYVASARPATLEEAKAALLSILNHWQQHGFGRWAVTGRETDRLIGYGGLRSLFGMPELVYHFALPHWGKGLATEMARAALRYGFEERGFDRIVAIAHPDNAASVRVLKKVGMAYEKLARYYDLDVVQYEILRHNYKPEGSLYIRESDEQEQAGRTETKQ